MADDNNSYTVPARLIKAPPFISLNAQALLTLQPQPTYPPIEDKAAWRVLVAQADHDMAPRFQQMAAGLEVETITRDLNGVRFYEAFPPGLPKEDRNIVLDFHGGGLILCGGETCKTMAGMMAVKLQKRVWSVDYRMPVDHPYPAGLDDGLMVYRALLQERSPSEIIVCGVSAGGNLAAALLLRVREAGLPMPAGLILGTPEVDLTESGDSFQTNMGVETMLGSLMPVNLIYANGNDLLHPHISPLFGDLSGFPPTILYTGTRDLFLSNTVRMHRALRSAGECFPSQTAGTCPSSGLLSRF